MQKETDASLEEALINGQYCKRDVMEVSFRSEGKSGTWVSKISNVVLVLLGFKDRAMSPEDLAAVSSLMDLPAQQVTSVTRALVTCCHIQFQIYFKHLEFCGTDKPWYSPIGRGVLEWYLMTRRTIFGTDGNDRILLEDQNYEITAFAGNNSIVVGHGDNRITAEDGNNRITAGDGPNEIVLGNGRNRVSAGDGSNSVSTGLGHDTIVLGDGSNRITSTGGNNRITLGNGDNHIETGAGNDRIRLGDGHHVISAGNGRNRIQTGDATVEITTGDGKDQISVGDGSGTILAGDGQNQISGGNGDYAVTTGGGRDDIALGAGNQLIDAGGGKNRIEVGDGDTAITTGDGDDEITVGDGASTISAGAGNNRIRAGDGTTLVTAGEGNNRVRLGDGHYELSLGDGNQSVKIGDGTASLVLGEGRHNIRFGDGELDLSAGRGNHRLSIGDGIAEVEIAGGRTTVSKGDGLFQFEQHTGSTRLTVGNGHATETSHIRTAGGGDQITLGVGVFNVASGAGNDRIQTRGGTSYVDAGGGNDLIHVGSGNDTIFGGAGDDRIYGGNGSNTVIYSGSITDYAFELAQNGHSAIVTSMDDVTDAGVDRLRNIEYVHFLEGDMRVALADVNDSIAFDDAIEIGEDGLNSFSVSELLANDVLRDGATVSINLDSASAGALEFDGETITYNPFDAMAAPGDVQAQNAYQAPTDSFTYTITGTDGETSTAEVALTINEPLIASDDRIGGGEFLVAEYYSDTFGFEWIRSIALHDGRFAAFYTTYTTIYDNEFGGTDIAHLRLTLFDSSGSIVERGIELFTGEQDLSLHDATITILANGNLAVAWRYGVDGTITNPIYDPFYTWVQVFDTNGTPLFEAMPIAGNRPDTVPSVEALDNGNFVVTQQCSYPYFDEERGLIRWADEAHYSLIDQNGTILASEMTRPYGRAYEPIAVPGGGFAIFSELGPRLYMTFFDENGEKQSHREIISDLDNYIYQIEAEVNGAGQIAVTWSDYDKQLQTQVFDLEGNALTERQDVEPVQEGSSYFNINYRGLTTEWLSDESYAITWWAMEDDPESNEHFGVPYVMIFGANGERLTERIAIDADADHGFRQLDIVATESGGFIIISQDENPETGDRDMTLRFFDANGERVESKRRLGSTSISA